ncbi:hypothetical protein GCL60_16005 [Silvanigrella paludirubra]|uniref:Ppx/GppA phosphatase N-terminal domain-containing protein n=2 Tax=Silvanigrella paludirubra TaxID=2499159 RepID=A0A6N6VRU2_9BACT|nr:hypothetical protein GCL60_16005 [Silvanigrella paludirubra]
METVFYLINIFNLFLLANLIIIIRKFYMILRSVLLGSIFSVILVSCNNKASNNASNQKDEVASDCKNEIRGGFDIGSGSTKLQIASVKVCKNGDITIEKSYFKKNANVQYAQDLKDSKSTKLSDEIIKKGVEAMTKLKEDGLAKLAKECGASCSVTSWRGIMTAAFRDATTNWRDAKKELSKVSDGLVIKRLDQDEEALYGFYPVIKLKGIEPQNSVIWDMGGGSTQITAFDKDFKMSDDFVPTGSYSIKTSIGSSYSKDLKGSDSTFNPIITHETQASNIVNDAIEAEIKKDELKFKDFFLNGKKYYVIGGILSRAIPAIAKGDGYSPDFKVFNYDQIQNASIIKPLSLTNIDTYFNDVKNLDDNKIAKFLVDKKIYSSEDVKDKDTLDRMIATSSNLLLTKLYMENKNLKIENIYPIVIDGSDTLMISPKFEDVKYWNYDNIEKK